MSMRDFHDLYERLCTSSHFPTDHRRVPKHLRIDDRIKLAAVLATVGGDRSSTCGQAVFKFHRKTMGAIVNQVYTAANSVLGYGNILGDPEALQKLAKGFQERYPSRPFMGQAFSQIVGAIDGCAVRIDYPGVEVDNPEAYKNHKGFYALILTAVADAKGRFVYYDMGFAGKTHDSTALRYSQLGELIRENKVLVGANGERYFLVVSEGMNISALQFQLIPAMQQREMRPITLSQRYLPLLAREEDRRAVKKQRSDLISITSKAQCVSLLNARLGGCKISLQF